uniref:Uncharacterized protein n=1 Tax=Anguilla anguilla TaxID=7936 RepID=A0A0E9WPS9_ANGAN
MSFPMLLSSFFCSAVQFIFLEFCCFFIYFIFMPFGHHLSVTWPFDFRHYKHLAAPVRERVCGTKTWISQFIVALHLSCCVVFFLVNRRFICLSRQHRHVNIHFQESLSTLKYLNHY